MEYTTEQIEEWKSKAQKWDALGERIVECYPESNYDEFGEELDEDEGGDLVTIGEYAAMAYGWL